MEHAKFFDPLIDMVSGINVQRSTLKGYVTTRYRRAKQFKPNNVCIILMNALITGEGDLL